MSRRAASNSWLELAPLRWYFSTRRQDRDRSLAATAPAEAVGSSSYFQEALLRWLLCIGLILGLILAALYNAVMAGIHDETYLMEIGFNMEVGLVAIWILALAARYLPMGHVWPAWAARYLPNGCVLRAWGCDLVVCGWLLLLGLPCTSGVLLGSWTTMGLSKVSLGSFGLAIVINLATMIVIEFGLHMLDSPLLCWYFARPKRGRQWCGHWLPRWRAAVAGLLVACLMTLCFCLAYGGPGGPDYVFGSISDVVDENYRSHFPIPKCAHLSSLVISAAAVAVYFRVVWAERGRIGDGPSWIRCRAAQVAQYLHLRRYLCWKLDMKVAARGLLQEWQRLREDIAMGCWQLLSPKHWLNALCPSKRVRRTIRRITGIRFRTSGYHESTVQELTWNRVTLIMLSAGAAIPLLAGWAYQRYWNPPRAFLPDNRPQQFFNFTASDLEDGDLTGDWAPAQSIEFNTKLDSSYESSWPVVGDGRTSLESTDLSTCPGYGPPSFWAGLKVTERYNDWLGIQLLCYCGYVLVCLTLIWLESDENIQLAVSCKLNAVYDPERSSKQRDRITQHVVIIVMVILSITFVVTLANDNFDEAFVVFASTGLQVAGRTIRDLWYSQVDRDVFGRLIVDEGHMWLPPLRLPRHAKMVGFTCSAQVPSGTAVLLVYEDNMSAEDVGFATFQGIFFLGGLISLYWAQSRMYDFINLDRYLRTLSAQRCADGEHKDAHEDGKESMRDSLEECPYAAFLRNIHENPRRIGRPEVTQYLYEEVDLPFLCAVEQKLPGLFYEIMNKYEADEVMRHVKGRVEVMAEQKVEEGDGLYASVNTQSEDGH